MGIEYSLRFCAPDAAAVAAVLRKLPAASEASPPANRFDLQVSTSAREWPQATVWVELGGACFCDNCGGAGLALLGEVVGRLVSAFGAVTVDER
jgi:hypothetical protein